MKSTTTSLITIAVLCLGAAPLSRAAEDSFVGKWKFNPEKSQLSGLTYQLEDAGNNKYTFKFGDTSETVSLDGKPHTTRFGNIWEVTKQGPNTLKWIEKRNGKMLSDATWTVADVSDVSARFFFHRANECDTPEEAEMCARQIVAPTSQHKRERNCVPFIRPAFFTMAKNRRAAGSPTADSGFTVAFIGKIENDKPNPEQWS
jgi:hypothetical protein